jgi:uncharacterized protein (TIGR00266 family)
MQTKIEGAPSFAYLHVDLAPGESITAESDAMASMDADLDMKAVWNGGFLAALARKFLGGESLFVNVFTNNTQRPRRVTLVQTTPGDIKEVALKGTNALCLQPGAYLASTPGVRLAVKWAGFASFLAREGLFKLLVNGQGYVWIAAYGGILFRDVSTPYIVDSSHLVAYEPTVKLKLQLAGGIFSSFLGGEGVVTRVEGQGKIAIQTRSLEGLRDFVNPKLY